jgi:hypothetical protein
LATKAQVTALVSCQPDSENSKKNKKPRQQDEMAVALLAIKSANWEADSRWSA